MFMLKILFTVLLRELALRQSWLGAAEGDTAAHRLSEDVFSDDECVLQSSAKQSATLFVQGL